MRTTFFFFTMLASVMVSAQSHINIEMLSATYTTSPAVKFRISWNSVPTVTGQTHNAKVWVWIDFLKFNADNTTTGNTWTRAEISATPAVSSSPTSTAALDASTDKGFWLNGVTGSYSATVTATPTNIPANTKFNWCAYVSDYPSNVTLDKGTYTFKGTINFIVNNPTQILTIKTIAKADLAVTSSSTFTDATDCPGIGSLYCPYTGSDLYMDATHLCQQRASGARNWEAYIKDSRDNKIYRITQFSDQSWWFADDLDVEDKRVGICSNKSYYDPYTQPSCPTGWTIPTRAQFQSRWTASTWNDDQYNATITLGTYWLFKVNSSCRTNVGCNGDRDDYIVSNATTAIYASGGINGCDRVGGRVRCRRVL